MHRFLLVAFAAFSLTACDLSGEPQPGQPGIGPGTGGNVATLGTLCQPGAGQCGAGQCVILSSGNPNQGYCSPTCSDDSQCQSGNLNPQQVTCFNPTVPNTCTITCDDVSTFCPQGLVCAGTPGMPFRFCTTPR